MHMAVLWKEQSTHSHYPMHSRAICGQNYHKFARPRNAGKTNDEDTGMVSKTAFVPTRQTCSRAERTLCAGEILVLQHSALLCDNVHNFARRLVTARRRFSVRRRIPESHPWNLKRDH